MPDDFLAALGIADPTEAKPAAAAPADAVDYRPLVSAAALKYGLPEDVAHRWVQQESRFNPRATSPKGAMGLAQLMPDTAKDYGVADPYDPAQNIDGGARYLSDLLKKYGGDMSMALAAYNAGPTAVDRAGGIPNFPETKNYVATIMGGPAPADGAAPAPGVPAPEDFLGSIGVDGKKAEETAAATPDVNWAGAGLVPYEGMTETLTGPQTATHVTMLRGHAYDETAPPGSIKRPLYVNPKAGPEQAPPGAYYVDADGKLKRAPGEHDSSALAGLGQGVMDVATSLGKALPGTGDSELLATLKAQQMGYGAQYGGDLKSGAGRFTGQLVASAPLIAGGEVLAAPLLARAGVTGAFMAGEAGTKMAPGVARFLLRGGSLAAHGAVQGAAGAGLISSASDAPVGEQIGLGAVGGAALGPVLPAVAAGFRWGGRAAGSLLRPLTEGGRDNIVTRAIDEAAGGPLTPDLTEYIPGVQPTLGEAGANAGVASFERVARTNPRLVERFSARLRANDEARAEFVNNLRGDRQTAADLASARVPVVDAARARAFQNVSPADPTPVVQAIDAALASPEAHMESVARPLQALRDKVVTPPPEMSPAEVADFNRKVAQTFGADAPALTADVMDSARAKLGAQFEDIAANTNIVADDQLRNGLASVLNDAGQVIEEGKLVPLGKLRDAILSTVHDGTISGKSYQALIRRNGPLDLLSRSGDSAMRHYAGQMRETLDDALERTMGSDFPGDRIPRAPGAYTPPETNFAPQMDLTDRALNYLRGKRGAAGGETRGPSLVDFLIGKGGVKPDGDALSEMEAGKSFGKRGGLLVRTNGKMTAAEALEAAHDAGYIGKPNVDGTRPEPDVLFDALRKDLGGSKVYANEPTISDDVKAHAAELDEMLGEVGADLSMPNGRIKQRMAEYFGSSDFEPAPAAASAPAPAKAAPVNPKLAEAQALTEQARALRDARNALPPGDPAWDAAHAKLMPVAAKLNKLTGSPLGLDEPEVAARLNPGAPAGAFTPDADLTAAAVKEFGTTSDPRGAGYILPDGKMLNFAEEGGGAERTLDHRAVGTLLDSSGTDAMSEFMNRTGAARVDLNSGTFEVQRPPSAKMIRSAVEAMRKAGKPLIVEASDETGRSLGSKEFERPTVEAVQKFLGDHLPAEPAPAAGAKPAAGGAAAEAGAAAAPEGMTPEAAARLQKLREVRLQYKNLKTAEMALGGDRAATFTVTPQQLYGAVKRNFGSYAYKGGGPLGDVAEAAVRAQEGRAPQMETDPRQLHGMRESLSQAIDKLEGQGTDAAHQAAERLRAVRSSMDSAIESGAPAYRAYLDVAERSNEPIAAMRYLQNLTLTDTKGHPTLSAVQGALNKIEKARAEPGRNDAKLISEATISQLRALRDDLKRAGNIDLGKARGSDTRQNLATDAFASEMSVPMAFGAGFVTGHPLVGPTVTAGKLFYGIKGQQVQDQLAARFLNPGTAPAPSAAPPAPRIAGPLKRLGSPILPVVGGVLANRFTAAR